MKFRPIIKPVIYAVVVFIALGVLAGDLLRISYALGYNTLIVHPYVIEQISAQKVLVWFNARVRGNNEAQLIANREQVQETLERVFQDGDVLVDLILVSKKIQERYGAPLNAETPTLDFNKEGFLEYSFELSQIDRLSNVLDSLEHLAWEDPLFELDYYDFMYHWNLESLQETLMPDLVQEGYALAQTLATSANFALGDLVSVEHQGIEYAQEDYRFSRLPTRSVHFKGQFVFTYR